MKKSRVYANYTMPIAMASGCKHTYIRTYVYMTVHITLVRDTNYNACAVQHNRGRYSTCAYAVEGGQKHHSGMIEPSALWIL